MEDRETWRALTESPHSLILIAAPKLDADRELFSGAVRKGHLVLRHADLRADMRPGTVDLERMRRFDLQQALEKGGLGDAEARQVAQAAGGNFTILRRVFANSAEVQFPNWSKDTVLAALLLGGAWEDEGSADQKIIEKLAGLPYAEARAVAAKWRIEPDAPLRLTTKERGEGKIWEFLSPLDAWESLRWCLNPAQMATFEKAAVEVLSDDNPALLLPPDDRPMAAIKGLSRKFSHNLRQGIAEILAIGATREGEQGMLNDLNIDGRAASIVRRVLPAGCGWQRWASLGQLLSSLVEAAPDEFLLAVERDLTSSDPQTVELMRQEIPPGGLSGAVYHSGLLWALETAAWSPTYYPRVAAILAQLTQHDPGGKWTNRPLGSAVGLFFSWRAQTVASLGARIDALQMLCERWPVAAWQIVVALIPSIRGIFMDNVKPAYRDWAAGWTGNITDAEYFAFLDILTDISVHLARGDPTRWCTLIGKIDSFYATSKKEYQKVRDAFQAEIEHDLTTEIRETLWLELRGFIHRHTKFSGAKWALPVEEVETWSLLLDKLEPDDPVAQFAYLFDSDGWEDIDESLTYEEKRHRRLVDRRVAVGKIWSAGGITEVRRLAERSVLPWAVGWALAEEFGDEIQSAIVPEFFSENRALEQVGSAFAAQRISIHDVEWAESVPAIDWSVEQTAMWALQMPFGVPTWDWIANRNAAVEKIYWERVGSWAGSNLDIVDVTRAFENYLRVGRAWDALQFLVSRKEVKQALNVDMLCIALEAVVTDESKHEIGAMDGHYIREALSFLQKPESHADEDRVSRLEFSLLPLLDSHFLLPITLQRKLSRDPQFFVDCLKLLFRPHLDDGESEEEKNEDAEKKTTEHERTLAQRIWTLLHDWRVIPGTNENGVVVVDALMAWVVESRQQAEAAHRLEVCDLKIGEVFAKSPADNDEGVPLVAVRDVIEEIKSEAVERGFMLGLENLRGVYSKSLDEGGEQERKLAAVYERYAQISARWPRTACVLRAVAKSYRRQAQREDERAQARE